MGKISKLKVLGMTLGLSLVLVACGTGDSEGAVVDVTNDKADVTVETVDDEIITQEEVWIEVNEDTGDEEEVKVTKHVEDGEVVQEIEERTLLTPDEEESEVEESEVEESEVEESEVDDSEVVDSAE